MVYFFWPKSIHGMFQDCKMSENKAMCVVSGEGHSNSLPGLIRAQNTTSDSLFYPSKLTLPVFLRCIFLSIYSIWKIHLVFLEFCVCGYCYFVIICRVKTAVTCLKFGGLAHCQADISKVGEWHCRSISEWILQWKVIPGWLPTLFSWGKFWCIIYKEAPEYITVLCF